MPRKQGRSKFAKQLNTCGLNPKEIALVTGYSLRTVYHWINGARVPHESTRQSVLARIALETHKEAVANLT